MTGQTPTMTTVTGHVPDCDLCGDTGYRMIETPSGTIAHICTCSGRLYQRRLADQLRPASGLDAPRLARARFADDPTGDTEITAVCRRFAAAFSTGDEVTHPRWLLLHGPYGTGKTHLAACIANAVLDTGTTVRFTDAGSMLQRLTDAQREGAYLQVMHDLQTAPLLVVDDLAARSLTEFRAESWTSLMNWRYHWLRPTVFTSNLKPGALADTYPALVHRMREPGFGAILEVGR